MLGTLACWVLWLLKDLKMYKHIMDALILNFTTKYKKTKRQNDTVPNRLIIFNRQSFINSLLRYISKLIVLVHAWFDSIENNLHTFVKWNRNLKIITPIIIHDKLQWNYFFADPLKIKITKIRTNVMLINSNVIIIT